MVKDRCEECKGVVPHRSKHALEESEQEAVRTVIRPRINVARRESDLPPPRIPQPLSTSSDSWGPVLQNRDHFLEMHLR